jgi:hypothetical protein
LGQGSSGAGIASAYNQGDGNPGSGGSGKLYGGGAGGWAYDYAGREAYNGGGKGAVRIIWGTNRSFPSTNTGDV